MSVRFIFFHQSCHITKLPVSFLFFVESHLWLTLIFLSQPCVFARIVLRIINHAKWMIHRRNVWVVMPSIVSAIYMFFQSSYNDCIANKWNCENKCVMLARSWLAKMRNLLAWKNNLNTSKIEKKNWSRPNNKTFKNWRSKKLSASPPLAIFCFFDVSFEQFQLFTNFDWFFVLLPDFGEIIAENVNSSQNSR